MTEPEESGSKIKYRAGCRRDKNSGAQFELFDENDRTNEKIDAAKEIISREGLTLHYLKSSGEASAAVEELMKGKFPLGLDIETAKLNEFRDHKQAGLEPHLSCIRLIQLYGGGEKVYVFDMFALNVKILFPIWDKPLVAHNAVFDVKHLLHAGAKPHQIGCTMLMANALTGKLFSLADLGREHLGWRMSKTQQISDWDSPTLTQDQLEYAALDSVAVYKMFRILMDQIAKNKLIQVYTLMRDAQLAIAKMELNGIYFDLNGHQRLMATWHQAKKRSAEELLQVLGPHVNPDSSKQISSWLQTNLDKEALNEWPRTKTGQLKTDRSTLARGPHHPLTTPLQKYKDAAKMLSTFGTGYAEHINPVTGRIHAYFRLGGTATGRLSCSGPNIQNPPRDKQFRKLFSAPAGRILVVADYGQIELRVAALISGDESMLEAYANGEDLHRKTAAAIAGVPLKEVTPEQRQAAKAVNFGLLYGQGPKGLARYAKTNYGVDMSEREAVEAREAFFQTYSGLKRWQQETARKAESSKSVVTLGGRVRDFSREARGYQYTEALNTPIQGGAAEVLLATLPKLDKYLEGLDAKLVNVVHDEIVLEVAKRDAPRTKQAVEKAMIEGMLAMFPNASTVGLVEAKAGANWAEVK